MRQPNNTAENGALRLQVRTNRSGDAGVAGSLARTALFPAAHRLNARDLPDLPVLTFFALRPSVIEAAD